MALVDVVRSRIPHSLKRGRILDSLYAATFWLSTGGNSAAGMTEVHRACCVAAYQGGAAETAPLGPIDTWYSLASSLRRPAAALPVTAVRRTERPVR